MPRTIRQALKNALVAEPSGTVQMLVDLDDAREWQLRLSLFLSSLGVSKKLGKIITKPSARSSERRA